MKTSYLKSLVVLFIICFLIIIIGYFLGNKKRIENDNFLKSSIFDIYMSKKVKLGQDFSLKGQDFNYKKVKIDKKIGKGFFINKFGEFLTSSHLFNNDYKYYIKLNNKNYNFEIIKIFEKQDIIQGRILNYKNKINKVALAPGKIHILKNKIILAHGNKIFTYKNNKKITGKIIGTNKSIKELKLNNLIETSIKSSPGDSGSPLFDKDGNVIGIFTAIKIGTNESYASKIPINIIF